MTLEHIRYFLEVSSCKSFSKAAQNLFISQPNLSKYIKALENELDFKLFDRSTHHVKLTDDGKKFFNSTHDLYYIFTSAIDKVKKSSQLNYEMLNVGLSFGECLSDELYEIFNQYNSIPDGKQRYKFSYDNFVPLINKLKSGEYDLAITTDHNIRMDKNINFIELTPVKHVLAINKNHYLVDKPDLLPSDFKDDIFYMIRPDEDEPKLYNVDWKGFSEMFYGLNIEHVRTSLDVLLNVQAGSGVGTVPSSVLTASYPDVVLKPYKNPTKHSMQCLAWHSGNNSPQIKSLIAKIKTILL